MTDRERLIELLASVKLPINVKNVQGSYDTVGETYLSGNDIERIVDSLLANGVIVPPCKVGDTVYVLEDFVWAGDCKECEHYEDGWYDSPSECGKTRSCRKSSECIEIVERTVTYKDILQYMNWDDFGKTVFLTKELAEKALAERIGK